MISFAPLSAAVAAAPANDTCAGAIPLTLNRVTLGTTVAASDDYQTPNDATCYSGIGNQPTKAPGRDVVYSFTAPADGEYTFEIIQFHPQDPVAIQNSVLYLTDCASSGTVSCIRGVNRSNFPRGSLNGASNGFSQNQSEAIDCVPMTTGQTHYVVFDDVAPGKCSPTDPSPRASNCYQDSDCSAPGAVCIPTINAGSRIALEVRACHPEVEPNDTPAQATPMVCGMIGETHVGPAFTCRLGTRDGSVCTRSAFLPQDHPDSKMFCSVSGGRCGVTTATGIGTCPISGELCQALVDQDCDPRCDVGPNAGKTCPTQAFCNPGSDQGATCAGTCQAASTCVDVVTNADTGIPCTPVCFGSSIPAVNGRYCSTLSGCPGGGTCVTTPTGALPAANCAIGQTCSRVYNEGDSDFYSLGVVPAGSAIFAHVDAKAANDGDNRLRVTTDTQTLQFDDDDGFVRDNQFAPVIAGALGNGSPAYIEVSKTQFRASATYEVFAHVRPTLAQAQLEDESGPHGNNDNYYLWPGDVLKANPVNNGANNGYVRGTFAYNQDSDCFKFLVNEGDLMDWYGAANPQRTAGPVTLIDIPEPIIYDAIPAGISNFAWTANPRKNTNPNVIQPTLRATSPAVTSTHLQWRAQYTGMLEVCFYSLSQLVGQGTPTFPNNWSGSLTVNCGPVQATGPGTTTADVSVVTSGPAGPVTTGDFVTYTITVTNTGGEIAQEISLDETLAPDLTFIGVSVDDGFAGQNTACFSLPTPGANDAPIHCINASMAPGTVTTYTLTVQVNNCIGSGVDIEFTPTITSVSTDPDPSDDFSMASFTTVAAANNGCTDILCSDGVCVPNLCTSDDTCQSGVCVSGTPPDCDDDSVCTEDVCIPEVGCVNDDSPVGDLCDDFIDCTHDFCDPVLGCDSDPEPAGTPCDDGVSCTSPDACDGQGQCVGTSNCDDGSACTVDSCDQGLGCVFTPVDCDDQNACTNDSCLPFDGCHHVVNTCDDGNPCTTDSCSPATGCEHTNNTNACSDGSACTTNDTCADGTCVGAPVSCNDGDPCTADGCNPASGCVFPPLNCDDGNACTTDACALVGGCHHTPISCFDDDSCTIDTCDAGSGCQHAPIDCDEETSEGVGGGGTVSTDPEGDGATPADPVETTITTPNGGTVTIEESQTSTPPPVGLSLLDLEIHVTAPPATAADPVRLVFRVDASALPPGFDVATLVVFKNGVAIAACTGPPDTASPDPCMSRVILPDGDLEVTVLTSTLSIFNFGFPDCQAPPETTGVRLAADKDTVTWTPMGGAGISYDAVRGEVGQWPVGSGPLEGCLAIDLAGASVTDPLRPSPGSALWYLVRARNACGIGGYGTRSSGAPRVVTECP